MDIPAFRENFPEFASTSVYPDAQVTFWATIAEAQVNQNVWQDLYPQGVQLYVAHEITIAAQNVQAAGVGGSPGQSGGIANSKAVGAVNVSYDAGTQTEKDAGWWNRTTYGQQFIRLARLFGSGAIQLSGSQCYPPVRGFVL